MQAIVQRLNLAKKRKGWTLKQLAQESGLSQGTVNIIMSGRLQKIKHDKLVKLANALDVSVDYLLSKEPETEISPSTQENKYLGLVKIACISPEVRVGDCRFNAEEIVTRVKMAHQDGAQIALLPELCITGYTCGDLFFQETLRNAALDGLRHICDQLSAFDIITVIGLPICDNVGKIYNAAAVVYHGMVLGIVPKVNLPNYNEFTEKRWFCAYNGATTTINLWGNDIPFGSKLMFVNTLHKEVRFALEICEDIWVADSPSIFHAKSGANAIFNLSASNETVVKAEYRKKIVELQSAKCNVIYAYCSSGPSESTSQTVFSAHNIICENGQCLAECKPFTAGYVEAWADFNFIENERARLDHSASEEGYTTVGFQLPLSGGERIYSNSPFVPKDKRERDAVCERTLTILAYGLKKRVEHARISKLVIGVSGGSDSTLALIVCQRALKLLNRPMSDLIAVTMPCFGTSERTLSNSIAMSNALGATLMKIDITSAVTQHLKDIGHDFTPDTTYENAQARERTQVLMDIANKTNGLVIGTGDMSECALGWATYNGDHMSMYGVNASVPKTLVKALLRYSAEHADGELKKVLLDVLDTPVSPELLPTDSKGKIAQKSEELVGPYELHDYFLFMLLRKGFTPHKVYQMAKISFVGSYDDDTILRWLKFFIRRFFTQQFKRSCAPDSVRLGSVDLSKLGMRMPSDACYEEWLNNATNKYK